MSLPGICGSSSCLKMMCEWDLGWEPSGEQLSSLSGQDGGRFGQRTDPGEGALAPAIVTCISILVSASSWAGLVCVF
jgi:hypothetical protein